MLRFNIKCSQKLDDGDTALIEEYRDVNSSDVAEIMTTYYQRSASKSYVDSFKIEVEIKR
jgi:hypothetical protein